MESNNEARKLKRAIIKEEFVAITGDYIEAIILNQFIYWSERVSDFDKFIEQENERARRHGMSESDLTHGWIYKTCAELSEETMLMLSDQSMRRHIQCLTEKGFISERTNPKYKWDRTKQYRVNVVEIAKALSEKGYTLDGYATCFHFPKIDVPISKMENGKLKNGNAIPETTTEFLDNTKVLSLSTEPVDVNKYSSQQIVDLYLEICKSLPKTKTLSTNRSKAIKARLRVYGIDAIKEVFQKAEASDFLKGKNSKNWSANLDWLMVDGNFAKVLDGKYDNDRMANYGKNNRQSQPDVDTSWAAGETL